MAIPGRKPKPANLKLITGNPGRRKINANAPSPQLARPLPPDHLSDEAKVEWSRVSDELYGLGLLSQVDRAALAAYCQAYARWGQAERALTEMAKKAMPTGALMIISKNGMAIPNPLVGVANKAMADVVRYAAEFGMTPSARSRIEAHKLAESPEDDVERFFR